MERPNKVEGKGLPLHAYSFQQDKFIDYQAQQIKELKEYAKHDQECGWWKDGGKNYLDDGCTCGLEELLNK